MILQMILIRARIDLTRMMFSHIDVMEYDNSNAKSLHGHNLVGGSMKGVQLCKLMVA